MSSSGPRKPYRPPPGELGYAVKGDDGRAIFAEPVELDRRRLPDDQTTLLIGAFVVGCARLDHILTLALLKYGEIHMKFGFPLVGRMEHRQKVERLFLFLRQQANTDVELKLLQEWTIPIRKIFHNRNLVSHGVYCGVEKTTGAHMFALTAHHDDGDYGYLGHKIEGILQEDLKKFAELSFQLGNLIANKLGVTPLPDRDDVLISWPLPPRSKPRSDTETSDKKPPQQSSRPKARHGKMSSAQKRALREKGELP